MSLRARGASAFALAALVAISGSAHAQTDTDIVRDGTIGPGREVQPVAIPTAEGLEIRIDESLGERPGGGANVFHSFERFDLGAGDTAIFSSNPDIPTTALVSRVTGGTRSQLFGRIRSTAGGADLYFLNRAGILLGRTASLDVDGSVHFTTADALVLADGARFAARLDGSGALLTSAPPVAFGFLERDTGRISLDGSLLAVRGQETIAFVGANVDVRDATIAAASGRVHLATQVGAGDLAVDDPRGSGGSLQVERARINVRGSPGGRVVLRGGNVVLDDVLVLADSFGTGPGGGIDIAAQDRAILRALSASSNGPGGDVEIAALRLLIDRGTALVGRNRTAGRGGDLRIEADRVELAQALLSRSTDDVGRGGDVRIVARELIARESRIDAVTRADGRAGDLDLRADRIEFVDSTAQSLTLGAGRSGDVAIVGGDIALRQSSSIVAETSGAGDSGHVSVSGDVVSLSGRRSRFASEANPMSTGRAGDVSIEARLVDLAGGAFVASNTFGAGDGGAVRVAAEEIAVDRGAIASEARPTSRNAKAGDVTIEAKRLSISNRTQIASTTFSSGEAGRVSVVADEIEASESSIQSQTMSKLPDAGAAGVVSVEAGRIELRDAAFFSTSSTGAGDAGDVVVRAGVIDLERSGIVSQTTSRAGTAGDAGSLDVEAERLRLGPESFVASSTFGPGEGGSISVRAGVLQIEERARILAESFDERPTSGDAGDISVVADRLVLERDSRIATSAKGSGRAGSIEIDAGEATLSSARILTDAVRGAEVGDAADGSIRLRAERSVRLEGGARVSASVTTGQGGDISIEAGRFLVVQDGSEILAETQDGTGGRIQARSDAVVIDGASRISADAGVGATGAVEIDSPDVNLEADLAALTSSYLDVSEQIRPGCEERGGVGGTFTVARLRGLPPGPDTLQADLDALEIGVSAWRSGEGGASPPMLTRLRTTAWARQREGDYAGSRVVLARSVALAERSDDSAQVAAALSSLAIAESALGRVDRATRLLERSASLARAADDRRLAAAVLNNLANQRALAGDVASARALYAESASLAHRAGRPLQAIRAIANAARATLRTGDVDRAIALLADAESALERASATERSRPDGTAAGAEQARRLVLALELGLGSARAEVAARSAAHRADSLPRANTLLRAALSLARESGDARALAHAYGLLGSIYETDGRMAEALYLTREASQRAETAAPETLYRWHWQEGRVLRAQGREADAIAAYRRAVSVLEQTRPESRAQYGLDGASFRDRLAPIYVDLADALLARAAGLEAGADPTELLLEARDTVERLKVAELRDYYRDECVADLEAKTLELDAVAQDAAVVYPIALRDRLELLVRLPSGLVRYRVDVSASELRGVVDEFRRKLQDRATHGYLASAQTLHRWLVAPYAGELARQQVQTLVFVPDGPLRTIPIGALHDGERFLVERYAHAVSPGLSLVDPRPLEREGARVLLAGVSEGVQDFAPLPNVPEELAQIRELFGGTVLLDRAFSPASIDAAVAGGRPTIVHIASHVVFTGNPRTSFLLTHDAKLPMASLADVVGRTRFRERPIELLTLSACRTALDEGSSDDGQAGLGLAGLAIRSGARSAVGSLWRISDDATSVLMREFYGELRLEGRSRAEALRRAQSRLIADEALRHPYYWSPFLLVSNWL